MHSYEAMFILKADLNEEQQKALVAELENILKENQAQIESSEVFGRRQLAYEINKNKEGLYYLMHFSSPTGVVAAKLKKACNINEQVLRTLVISKRPRT